MNKFIATSILLLGTSAAFCQALPPANGPVNKQAPPPTPAPPQYQVLTPKPIGTLPGDIKLQRDVEHLNNLSHQFDDQMARYKEELTKTMSPEYNDTVTSINADIVDIRKANNWGPEAQYDMNKKQFVLVPNAAKPAPTSPTTPNPVTPDATAAKTPTNKK